MSPFSLALGDCLEELRRLHAESIDAVITDPPYGIDYQSHWGKTLGRKVLNDRAPFVWFLPEVYRVLRPDTGLVVFGRWDVQEDFRRCIELAGFKIRSQLVWDRDVHGMGDTTSQFAPQHDMAWFAVKGRFRFPNGRPRSVMRHRRAASHQLLHPTEKPVDLMRQLVVALTRPGDTVLDPFAGSGSTGVAAIAEGRRFVGIELDPEHYETARGRLALATENET